MGVPIGGCSVGIVALDGVGQRDAGLLLDVVREVRINPLVLRNGAPDERPVLFSCASSSASDKGAQEIRI